MRHHNYWPPFIVGWRLLAVFSYGLHAGFFFTVVSFISVTKVNAGTDRHTYLQCFNGGSSEMATNEFIAFTGTRANAEGEEC